MVEKFVTSDRNVVDFRSYQQARSTGIVKAAAMNPRNCRHCGAALAEGESDDDCSSVLNVEAPRLRETPRKSYAE
jgi:hypothetical protein